MSSKELSGVYNSYLKSSDNTIESVAMRTSLTIEESTALSRGELLPLESRSKLAELPLEVQVAHQEQRKAMIESFCVELRSGQFSKAESARFSALLGLNDREDDDSSPEMDMIMDTMKSLRQSVSS